MALSVNVGVRESRPHKPIMLVLLCLIWGAPAQIDGNRERSRSQLLLKFAGAGNVLILTANVLAVNGVAENGALRALYSVKK